MESEEEAVEQMRRILHTEKKISSAQTEEEVAHYQEVDIICEEHVRESFRNGRYDSLFSNLRRLVHGSGRGLYALFFSIGIALKLGMSLVDKMIRAKQQNYKAAFDVCDLDELDKLCPKDSDVVMKISALKPPRS